MDCFKNNVLLKTIIKVLAYEGPLTTPSMKMWKVCLTDSNKSTELSDFLPTTFHKKKWWLNLLRIQKMFSQELSRHLVKKVKTFFFTNSRIFLRTLRRFHAYELSQQKLETLFHKSEIELWGDIFLPTLVTKMKHLFLPIPKSLAYNYHQVS